MPPKELRDPDFENDQSNKDCCNDLEKYKAGRHKFDEEASAMRKSIAGRIGHTYHELLERVADIQFQVAGALTHSVVKIGNLSKREQQAESSWEFGEGEARSLAGSMESQSRRISEGRGQK